MSFWVTGGELALRLQTFTRHSSFDSIPRMKRRLFLLCAALLCSVLSSTSLAQRQQRRQTSRPESQPSAAKPALTPRRVTVRLKKGDPVIGSLVGVEGDAVQLEVAGNRLSIKLDEVVSLVFVEEAAQSPAVERASPSKEAAQAAIKSLRKLTSAVEIGVNFRDYSSRLIDVKSEVDDALLKVDEGPLKQEIAEAMAAYGDAGRAWNRIIQTGSRSETLFPDSDPIAAALQIAYNVPTQVIGDKGPYPAPFRIMSGGDTLRLIWAAAQSHVEKSESLIK
jgi:hypothetical protein